MTYGHLQADCLYTGISSGPNARCRVWEALLYNTVQYSTIQYSTVQYSTVLYCTVLYCTVLYCAVLYCTVLYCTVLCCTVLYCTVLYCTVYCTVLYCTVLYLLHHYSGILISNCPFDHTQYSSSLIKGVHALLRTFHIHLISKHLDHFRSLL